MPDNKQTKHIGGHIQEYKEVDRNGVPVGIIEGYIATWDIDRGKDRFQKGAFLNALKRHKKNNRPIRLKDGHGRTVGGFPIATVKEDDKGLFGVGEINLEVQQGKELFALVKQGVLSDMSIGYGPTEKHYKNGIRVITESEVWEGSIVDEPMNPAAIITDVKDCLNDRYLFPFAALDYQWNEKEALDRVDGGLFLDIEGEHFPILDIIDGKTFTIPRAIFSARAILSGAKSYDIEDIEDIKETIDAYYRKMDMEPPFNGGTGRPFCLTEIKNVSKSILSGILRNCNISKDAADYAAGKLMSREVDDNTNDLDGLNESLKSLRKTFNKE